MSRFFKKNIGAIIVAILLCVGSLFYVLINNENTDTSQKITSYKINATFNDNGDMTVIEEAMFNFKSTKRAMFKDFVYEKQDVIGTNERKNSSFDKINSYMVIKDSSGVAYATNKVKYGYSWKNDLDEYGERITCDTSLISKSCESMFAYVESGFKNNTIFEYHYTITDVVNAYDNIAAFNWIFVDQSPVTAENIEISINFEKNLSTSQQTKLKENFYIHGNIYCDNLLVSNKGISFSVPSRTTSQVVEVRAGFDNELTSKAETRGYDSVINALNTLKTLEAQIKQKADNDATFYSLLDILKWIFLLLFLSLFIFSVIFAYIKFDKEHKSAFDNEYFRELPAEYGPAIMGYLYHEEDVGKDDLSATIMDLIRKGFIELDLNGESTQEKRPNYKLIRIEKDIFELDAHEKLVLNWFFDIISSDKSTLTLNELEGYIKNERQAQIYLNNNKKFIRIVTQESKKFNFFDDLSSANVKMSWFYLIGIFSAIIELYIVMKGITFALFLAALVIGCSIIFASYLKNLKRRSINGNEDFVRWKAFEKFLLEFSNFDDYPMPAIAIWEHYMVYAVAFGIADKVNQQLRLKFTKMNLSYENSIGSTRFMRFHYCYYLSYRINSSMNIANTTIMQARAARARQSGGGGNFGGGRSFGGGGGGFRSR